ncbi:hypothetical protein Pmani_032525 [Petrolisthes manimaculis]|uniref:Uncharacterized protein n=1 Tax=Petrolisthes manimaculis TaxID=1843537 RepID=A0AAE1NSG0_9EUCA|nr:hypothetical protein Pmani_032525 [Petrolisthes manimaculis]
MYNILPEASGRGRRRQTKTDYITGGRYWRRLFEHLPRYYSTSNSPVCYSRGDVRHLRYRSGEAVLSRVPAHR